MNSLTLQERKQLIRAALGEVPLDLIIKNIHVVNVYTGSIESGSIGILAGRIVTSHAGGYTANSYFDGSGLYALPGFIDSHVHLDSTLVVPENLGCLILPHGTTAMLADPMEIANVAGMQGFKAFQSSSSKWFYHVFWEVSSRVPTAPGLETTGGELGVRDVSEILSWPASVSLGELDPSKVLSLQDEYLKKIEAALDLGKICNGHAVGRVGKELTAYVCGGLTDDHECVNYSDAQSRLKLGMAVLIREGSTERNLEPIISGLVKDKRFNLPQLMFCTDDKHPDEIQREGHVNYMVNKSIALGVPPIIAIQMATINAAKHFRIDNVIGSLSPGRWADIVLVENLQEIIPREVFYKGEHLVREGQFIGPKLEISYPDWLMKTVKIRCGDTAADYRLFCEDDTVNLWVIDLIPHQIINKKIIKTLKVKEHKVSVDISQDILKLAVVERYGKNGNIGISFVRGFGIRSGALASSVAHDHHNIIVVGTNDEDMAICIQEIAGMNGGLIIVNNGKVLGKLALPIGGLMSDQPADIIIEELDKLNQLYRNLGGVLPAPFMTISFISLPTVPDLGLTDKGLIDVMNHTILKPFVNQ